MSSKPETSTTNFNRALEQYFGILSDPFNSGICPIPDSVPDAFVLKRIEWAVNVSIPNLINGAAGFFIFTSHYNRPVIRHYGFDPATQTSNLLSELLPTEDLSLDYDYYRHISTGVRILANTVNGGAFAVAGSFNAIAFEALPPVRSTLPSAITQYKRANYDSAQSVPVSDGMVMISPLAYTDEFKRFQVASAAYVPPSTAPPNTTSVVSTNWSSAETTFRQSLAIGAVQAMVAAAPVNIMLLSTLEPAPWGGGTINVNFAGTCSAANPNGGVLLIQVSRFSANPATYARVISVTENFTLVVPPSSTAGLVFRTGANGTFRVSDQPGEIANITVTYTCGDTVNVTWQATTNITFTSNFAAIKELYNTGCITSYQSVTQLQMSLSGVANYEVVPKFNLTRNVPIGYNVEVDEIAMIARNSYIRQLGNPLRNVYSIPDYSVVQQQGYFSQGSGAILANASTLSKYLWKFADTVAPIALRAGGTLAGSMVGNPMLGRAAGSIASGLYTGSRGIGTNKIVNASTCNSLVNCSTVGAAMNFAQGVDEDEGEVYEPVWKVAEFNELYEQIIAKVSTSSASKPESNDGRIVIPWRACNSRTDPISVQARSALFAKGDSRSIAIDFRNSGYSITRFPVIIDGTGYLGALVATTLPVWDGLSRAADYNNVNGVYVDKQIPPAVFKAFIKLTRYASLKSIVGSSDNLYVTVMIEGLVNLQMGGTSYLLALYALMNLFPATHFYSGSSMDDLSPVDFPLKVGICTKYGAKLFASNGISEFTQVEGSIPLSEFCLSHGANHPIVTSVGIATWPYIGAAALLASITGSTTSAELKSVAKQEAQEVSRKAVQMAAGTPTISEANQMFEKVPWSALTLNPQGPLPDFLQSYSDGFAGGPANVKALITHYKSGNTVKLNALMDQIRNWILARGKIKGKKKKTVTTGYKPVKVAATRAIAPAWDF